MPERVMTMGDGVDRWLQDTMAPTGEDAERGDVHLAVLKERLRTRRRERRRRIRWAMTAVPVVAVIALGVGVLDLGGDSFELRELESPVLEELGVRGVENEFRGIGLGVPAGTSDDVVHELNQQMAAGEGLIIRVEGWSLDGATNWSLMYRHEIGGEIVERGRPPSDPPSESTRTHLDYILEEWSADLARIEAGEIAPAGRKAMAFDGRMYDVEFWRIDSARFGEVIYYKGTPSR